MNNNIIFKEIVISLLDCHVISTIEFSGVGSEQIMHLDLKFGSNSDTCALVFDYHGKCLRVSYNYKDVKASHLRATSNILASIADRLQDINTEANITTRIVNQKE